MFNFNPANGLSDVNGFPTNPDSEGAARAQFMTLFNQLKEYLNLNDIEATLKKSQLIFVGDGATGRIEFPMGDKTFMIQWGTATTGSETVAIVPFYYSYANVIFPKPFVNKCLHIGARQDDNIANWLSKILIRVDNSVDVYFTGSEKCTNNRNFAWFAIGF